MGARGGGKARKKRGRGRKNNLKRNGVIQGCGDR